MNNSRVEGAASRDHLQGRFGSGSTKIDSVLGRKIRASNKKNFQYESCRKYRDLPTVQRASDFVGRARWNLGFTPSNLIYCEWKILSYVWWNKMRFVGIERYRRDLQLSCWSRKHPTNFQWPTKRKDFRAVGFSVCRKGKRKLLSMAAVYGGMGRWGR